MSSVAIANQSKVYYSLFLAAQMDELKENVATLRKALKAAKEEKEKGRGEARS